MEDRSVLSREAPAPSLDFDDRDVYLHPQASPTVVVLIHGGFWRPEYDRVHLRPMAAALQAAKIEVVSLEYRREPGNPQATLDDIAAHMKRFRAEVVLVGHSAGGHLALWAAAMAPPARLRGVIGLAPVADVGMADALHLDDDAVRDFTGGSYQDLDPVALPAPAAPAVLIHGDEDDLVPIGLSQSYVAVHRQARLHAVKGAGHFAFIDPFSDAWPIVIGELSELLA